MAFLDKAQVVKEGTQRKRPVKCQNCKKGGRGGTGIEGATYIQQDFCLRWKGTDWGATGYRGDKLEQK